MSDTDLNALFQKAVDSYDKAFLDAESALTAQGDTAVQLLRSKQTATDLSSFARFVAATLADGIAGKAKSFADLNAALDALVKQLEPTPIGTPPADIAAGTMSAHSKELSDLLALHLVKETEWPYWRALGVLVYLGYYASSSVLPALEQFRTDLKSGKHPTLTEQVGSAAETVIEKLDQAADLVRIVIEDETFKTELDKVKQTEGDKTAQTEAAKLAIAQAVSTLYGQPENAQKIDLAIESIRATLLDPVLQATRGTLNPDFVRGILATYILGEDSTSSPTPSGDPGTDTQPKGD